MLNSEFVKAVTKITQELKVPKSRENKYGGFKYRSCEDILDSVKPLLGNYLLYLSDSVETVGERIYIKATATLTDGENELSATGYAREALNKKGMDEAQVTGGASSYARKYALNGLFCIDDGRGDPDNPPEKPEKEAETDAAIFKRITHLSSAEKLEDYYRQHKHKVTNKDEFVRLLGARKAELKEIKK